eukprot:12491280-Alexandrium_andersonii.AAC.1
MPVEAVAAAGQRLLAPLRQGPSQGELRPLAVISLFDGVGIIRQALGELLGRHGAKRALKAAWS